MATKAKESRRDSADDLLSDLQGYDDDSPVKSARASQPARDSNGRAWSSTAQASKKSFLEEDFFSKLTAEDIESAEGSSASDKEPQALLQSLKDMDDMDAELLGIPKPSSGPGKTTVKGPRKCEDSMGGGVKISGKLPALEKEPSPVQTPLHMVAPVRRRAELTFEDDSDDLMDALGLGSSPKGDEKQGKKAEEGGFQPVRSKLDELLGRGSVAKILEQPAKGEHREFKLDPKYQKQPEKEEGWDKEDFVFGAYQPTVASLPKGQLSRRQSVSRFSAENSSEPQPKASSKLPPARQNSRGRGDWLGLKDEDFMDVEPLSPVKTSPVVNNPSPVRNNLSRDTSRRLSPVSQLSAAQEAAAKPSVPEEEEDWLSAALALKKAQAQAKAQERNVNALEAPGGGLDPHTPVSQPAASTGAPQQAAALQDNAASTDSPRQLVPWLSTVKQASAQASEAAKENPSRDTNGLVPTALFPGEQETQAPAPLVQVTAPRPYLQAAPPVQAESSALGLLPERRLGAPAAQPYEDASGYKAALLSTEARVAELESQVRTLELERTQHKLLLESLQQRHQENLDLLESTHRNRVKVVEETCGQREERLRREKEQLEAQLLSQRQDMEQARAELQAQHQQHLAALAQQNTLELERVQELQRMSVQEMRKDYEEQLQRLKWLKDQEIKAVTSAMSHTRSLNNVIEKIEKVSSNLHDLSHKIEATHQDRLSQQQKDMEELRSQLQEVIAKLGKQIQLLEQPLKVTTEQSKMEPFQHSLEEQQPAMTHQLSVKQAELAMAQEQAELKIQVQKLKNKENQLARDRELLDEAWQELKLENEKTNRAELHIRQREEEVNRMMKLSSQKCEEGERALQEARRIESEHQTRLQVMQKRLEWVHQQEQQLDQAQLSFIHQRRQLEQLREEVHTTLARSTGQDLGASAQGLSSMLAPATAAAPHSQAHVPDFLSHNTLLSQQSLVGSREALPMAGSAEFYATVEMMKYWLAKDRESLEEEVAYLETLRREPYNT